MTRKLWKLSAVLTLALLAVFAVAIVGCSDDSGDDGPIYDGDQPDGDEPDGDEPDGDNPDGDNPDGDLPDGDQPDGDVDGDTDGDEPDGDTDGDEPDGDVPTTGSIAGTVYTSADLAQWNMHVALYDVNPFEQWGAAPVDTVAITGVASETEKPFTFDEIETGRYYLWAYIDVDNDDDTANDVFNVYPKVVTMVAQDPELNSITGADIFIQAPNSDLGSIAGKLHGSPAYQERRIMMVASRVAEEKDDQSIEYWPSAVVFLEPGAEERDYQFNNLNDGTYYTFAYVSTGDETAPLLYASPYEPLEVVVDSADKKDYADEVFYLGIADPAFGSISGTITLPAAVAGEVGVYLFASKVEDDVITEVSPLALVLVKNDGATTSFPYTVGNLESNQGVWVAGGIRIADQEKLALGYHVEELTINLDVPAEKDLTGKDMTIPITTMTGTVSVTDANDPAWARVVLTEMTVDIFASPMISVTDFGGGTDVALEAPVTKGTVNGDYTMFPVKGGQWSVVVVLDTDATEGISDNDQWCFQWSDKKALAPKITVDGTQLEVTGMNINVDTSLTGGWLCSAPPAQ